MAHLTGPEVMELVGDWGTGSGPLYRRLGDGLRRAIERGFLRPGTRLPSERALARLLAVSRTTVIAAYEALKGEGYLESRQGSGTWVSTDGDRGLPAGAIEDVGQNALSRRAIDGPGGLIDFTCAAPSGLGLVSTLTSIMKSLSDEDVAGVVANNGYLPAGLEVLRQRVADRFVQLGAPTTVDEILITTGAQQAIALLADLYVEPGANVIVENPTYPGALDAFRMAGGRMLSVPVGEEGADIDALEDLMSRASPTLVYLIPTVHNPTGTVMPAVRRRRIAKLAARFHIPVVDDMTLADISHSLDPFPPPLVHYGGEGSVITLGSMGKLVWGGLRLGWVRAPEALIRRVARVKVVADCGSPVINQLLAVRLLDRVEEIAAARHAEAAAALELASSLLGELLPSWTWSPPAGGLSLWIRLPQGDATEFAQLAQRHGVGIVPGPDFDPEGGHRQFFRLAITQDLQAIRVGVQRLADAWDEYLPHTEIRPTAVKVIV